MPIRFLHLRGYRSLLDIKLRLSGLTVVTGANGTGKSNLYQSLRLLSRAAKGELGRALAEEGGMPSVLWSGPRPRKHRSAPPVRVRLGVTTDRFTYELACGLPPPTAPQSLFHLDPEVKLEQAWLGQDIRPSMRFLNRNHGNLEVKGEEGEWSELPFALVPSESVLSQLSEPHRYPVLAEVRDTLSAWRFYHGFRTDANSPLRRDHVGTRCMSLSDDGHDLAAAIGTIFEIGDAARFNQAVAQLRAASTVSIQLNGIHFSLMYHTPELFRPLAARELSDGTLRFLALAAALLTPRPPPLLAFNEPEASLHPDMIAPLADLLADAANRTQVWVTTHSATLVNLLESRGRATINRLKLVNGATTVEGQGLIFHTNDEDESSEEET